MKNERSIYTLIRELAAERVGEFDREELVPAVAAEFRERIDELAVDQARTAIAKCFRDGDSHPGQDQLFDNDAVVSIGDRKVIRRGSMDFDQAERRREVKSRNYKAQFDSWRVEDDYLAERIDWLRRHPGTTIDDYGTAHGEVAA